MIRHSSKFVLRRGLSARSTVSSRVVAAPLTAKNHLSNHIVIGRSAAFSTRTNEAVDNVSSSSATETGKCPFRTASASLDDLSNGGSAAAAAAAGEMQTKRVPTLMDVPSVPVMGVFVNAIPGIGKWLNDNIYKNPEITPHNAYAVHNELYQKYGSFYTTYIPGLGSGLYPKVYVIMDPDEMKKVIRQEGSYPRGGVEGLKPMIRWMKKNEFALAGFGSDHAKDNGFLGRGETWKKYRNFLQTDLLSPKSAAGYVPGVAHAARIASRGAPKFAADLNIFTNYCAFDMFQAIMFGQVSKLADPDTPSDPTDVQFCELAIDSLAYLIQMSNDPKEAIKAEFGWETETCVKFETCMDSIKQIVMHKLKVFQERYERGELNENEKNSYFAHAIERQRSETSDIDADELMQIALIMLNASVDTTSTFINWALLHLSTNIDVQDKLYEELRAHVNGSKDGILTAEMLTKNKSPYLHAVLRESHRITPVYPMTMIKSNSVEDIELHGVTIPKDSMIGFDPYPIGMDPKIVDEPEQFKPERWIGDEPINARKGTPAEVLDSIMYRDPFSQGARRCPGSRVAVNETQLILSQLILDWKISAPEEVTSYKDIEYTMKTLLVAHLPEMKIEARV